MGMGFLNITGKRWRVAKKKTGATVVALKPPISGIQVGGSGKNRKK